MVFESYAKYYDLFYQEKDYEAEVDFVTDVGKLTPPMSVLDLGCGTGGHVLPLAKRGFQMTGVDLSEVMISQARQKASDQNLNAEFSHADIRSLALGRTFDAVISMFAVMGYQTSNTDLYSAMQAARNHLQAGGLFIFDAWFGPAVLRELPATRVRELQNGEERIIRIAVPELDPLLNTVTVHYTVIRLSGERVLDESRESHRMRFLFAPEVEFFARQAGFEVLNICPFMDAGRRPTELDWNVTWVLRAA